MLNKVGAVRISVDGKGNPWLIDNRKRIMTFINGSGFAVHGLTEIPSDANGFQNIEEYVNITNITDSYHMYLQKQYN